MDTEVVKWFAIGFGAIVGIPTIKLVWTVATSWKGMSDNVTSTKATAERTEEVVGTHAKALQTIEQTLHGPKGDNGMYSDVRTMKSDIEELKEERRTAKGPRRKPGRKGGRRFGEAA